MIRKQVHITPNLDQTISLMAQQDRKPEAAVIRELLELGIRQRQPARTAGEALLALAALGRTHGLQGPPDLSARIDDYLYGDAE
jgi:hypothetical protein